MYEEFKKHSIKVYGAFIQSKEILTCTSGGVATALSKQFIESGGYVAGVRYTKDFLSAEYIIINKLEDLDQLKGSKYIDPEMNNIFQKVKTLLDNHKNVLFIGLPCFVGALNLYLKKEYNNLLTCELVCHGPTFTEVHKQYIGYLEKKFHSTIIDFSVRHKIDSWVPYYLYAKFANGKEFYKEFYKTAYGKAFSIYGKERCYKCRYKGNNRTGDIQIGDYWGIDTNSKDYNNEGTSCVLVHTAKGEYYLKNNCYLTLFETTFDNVVRENKYILYIKKKNNNYNKFKKDFNNKGLFYAVKRSLTFKQKILKLVPNNLKKILKRFYEKLKK